MKTGLCNGKVLFSKNGAEKFIRGKKLSRVSKKKFRVYFCRRCKNYHLTTKTDGVYE